MGFQDVEFPRFRKVADSEVMRPPLDGALRGIDPTESEAHANVGDFVEEKLHVGVRWSPLFGPVRSSGRAIFVGTG